MESVPQCTSDFQGNSSVLSRKPELNTEALLQNPTGSWQPATIDSVLQVVI